MNRFEGVFTALVTPFTSNDRIDEAALRELIQFQLAAGVHGLHPGGTTGEFVLLTHEERKRVAEIVVSEASGHVPVIVHTGHVSTNDALELSRHALEAGAEGVSLVAPYYFGLGKDALVHHFTTIASQLPDSYPVFLYNIPQRSGNAITPDVLELVRQRSGNVVGIKDSQGDLHRFSCFLATGSAQPIAFIGSDSLILAAVAVGARGVVSGNANAFPEATVALYEAAKAGRWDYARRLQKQVEDIAAILGHGTIPLIKAALRHRGIEVGGSRLPLEDSRSGKRTELARRLNEVIDRLGSLLHSAGD